jgi:WD40 repeat protein
MRDCTLITETASLIYFCLDASERYALCTTKDQGLHLWDLETRSLVRRFHGSKHGEYVIFSSFGGHNQHFVATGSEGCHHCTILWIVTRAFLDHMIYIWHRDKEQAVRVLGGHTGVVNAVSWNPTDPSMLASCSDDGTVRIWAPEPIVG